VLLAIAGLCFQLLAVACFVLILRHAFQRSLGSGFMVLLIPLFVVYYGFAEFEHRHRGLVLAGAFGGLITGVVLRTLGTLHFTGT
jgi:translocator protein